jgi:hypothetical protein
VWWRYHQLKKGNQMAETVTVERSHLYDLLERAKRLGIDFILSDEGCWWQHKNCDYKEGPFKTLEVAVKDAMATIDGIGR